MSQSPAELEDGALLLRIWNARGEDIEAFNDAFLAAVPPKQLRATIANATDKYGQAIAFKAGAANGRINLLTDTHRIPLDLVRDDNGLIAGLLVRTPIAVHGNLSSMLTSLVDPDAQSSWVLFRDGVRQGGESSDRPLAVGSAFKLHVLDAFRLAVGDGRHGRDDVVTLEERHRSWPSGIMQDWPIGSPITLGTVAQLMMSLSDNTATDLLIDVLGRASIESLSPYSPLLTTRDLFRVKAGSDLEKRYADADTVKRRRLLEEIADLPLPALQRIPSAPLEGVEWYATVEQLCAVIERVADEPEMTIETGIANRDEWSAIAYKGGSEVGVLNGTYRLVAGDGTTWCLAATWNGTLNAGRLGPIDAEARQSAMASVLAVLAEE